MLVSQAACLARQPCALHAAALTQLVAAITVEVKDLLQSQVRTLVPHPSRPAALLQAKRGHGGESAEIGALRAVSSLHRVRADAQSDA